MVWVCPQCWSLAFLEKYQICEMSVCTVRCRPSIKEREKVCSESVIIKADSKLKNGRKGDSWHHFLWTSWCLWSNRRTDKISCSENNFHTCKPPTTCQQLNRKTCVKVRLSVSRMSSVHNNHMCKTHGDGWVAVATSWPWEENSEGHWRYKY